jgi:methyl-accepting chemotaxis protein
MKAKKFGIGVKLIAGFFIVSLIGGFIGFIGISNIKNVSELVDILYNKGLLSVMNISEIKTQIILHNKAVYEIITTSESGYDKEAQKDKPSLMPIESKLDGLLKKYKDQQNMASKEGQLIKKLEDFWTSYKKGCDESISLALSNNTFLAKMTLREKALKSYKDIEATVEQLVQISQQSGEKVIADSKAIYKRNFSIMIIIVAICFVISIGFGIFLTKKITKPINVTVTGLSEVAENVLSASVQISSASQSLAEGASEQAAGIEETSSSIEEMASMTRKNADNANQANLLMVETAKVVEEANRSMKELTESMREITVASDETAKIIKTIDEIAFQTN